MALHLTVLGDSSSSGIGQGRACYPFKLFGLLRGERDVCVTNCAVPGITSADACRFFRADANTRPLDCLVVYLGNNEGAVSPPKGRYRPFRTWLAELGAPRDRPFRPVLSPPRFRFTPDVPLQTVATSPEEFGDNLRAIVGRARRRGAQVILVNPVANRRFPSGAGVPNLTYFAFLDELEALGDPAANDPVDAASRRLADGHRLLAGGRPGEAIAAWEPLLAAEGVAGFIARHNVACARARLGEAGADSALRSLLGEQPAYDSVVLYNLGLAKRSQGAEAEAARLLDDAREADASIYRIRRGYREAVARFSSSPGVQVLDLDAVLGPADFVDYCHPTEEGHERIAAALADLVRAGRPPGPRAGHSRYDLVLPSPDYLRRPGDTLVDYYCIDWPLGRDRIAPALAAARAGGTDEGGDELQRCAANFLAANGAHPAFTEPLDLAGKWAPGSHEILSMPEQFLYRLMHVYSAEYERRNLASRLAAGALLEGARFGADDYARIILRSTPGGPEADLEDSAEYLGAVMRRVGARLRSGDRLYRITLGERLRTVMTWFTREAFRHGTQSRMSMMYARSEIDRVLEGLIVAVVIADRRGDGAAVELLDALLARVLALLAVHEEHVRRYHYDRASFCAADYAASLAGARRQVEACLDGRGGDRLR